ncbi:hypothetical protein RclHR1_19620001, partial [Rhizophagus clarus]
YPGKVSQELSKYWDVCPVLLDYIQTLAKFTLERALLSSWQISEEVSKLGQDVNQDAPIIDSDANAQMDIEISHSEANQSTINMMLITKESNDETSFQPVLSKSQKKKQRKKAKAEQETSKARKNSRPSLDPLAKQFIPPNAKTRPGKKVTTGTNNILVHHSKGNASRQQYSSSTKPGKDSLKTEYDDKKHKSKSKRTIANIDWYQLFIKWKQQASPLIELNNELQEIYSEDYQFSLRELEAWKTFLRTAGAHNITS